LLNQKKDKKFIIGWGKIMLFNKQELLIGPSRFFC